MECEGVDLVRIASDKGPLGGFCKPHYRYGQPQMVLGGWGSQILRQSAHESGKVFSPTNRPPLSPGNISGTYFCYRLSHSAAGRIMSMKNSNDTVGNRTRDLPTCSAVPLRTAPPRAREDSAGTLMKRDNAQKSADLVYFATEASSHAYSRTLTFSWNCPFSWPADCQFFGPVQFTLL